jgi:hypothetical protein
LLRSTTYLDVAGRHALLPPDNPSMMAPEPVKLDNHQSWRQYDWCKNGRSGSEIAETGETCGIMNLAE